MQWTQPLNFLIFSDEQSLVCDVSYQLHLDGNIMQCGCRWYKDILQVKLVHQIWDTTFHILFLIYFDIWWHLIYPRVLNIFLSNRQLQIALSRKSLQEHPVNAGVPHGSILGPSLFMLYINDLPYDFICDITYADDTTPYSKCDQISDLLSQPEFASKLASDLRNTVSWGRKWFFDFNALKTQLVLFDQPDNSGVIDMKMDESIHEESSFKIPGLSFSSILDWSSYIASTAKTASRKNKALICSVYFLSHEVGFVYLNLSYDHA